MTMPQDIERRERYRACNFARLEEPDLAPGLGNRAPPGCIFERNYHYVQTVIVPEQSRIFR
jgi:hypothetical protein